MMRNAALIVAGILLSVSANAQEAADVDGAQASPQTQLCVAALESRESMIDKAKELGVRYRQLKRVKCNDLSILRIASMTDRESRERAIATVQ